MINRLPALIGQKQVNENRVINVATIADETGLSRQTIYTWLNNDLRRVEVDTIEALCKYFKCNVGDLLTVVDELPERIQN